MEETQQITICTFLLSEDAGWHFCDSQENYQKPNTTLLGLYKILVLFYLECLGYNSNYCVPGSAEIGITSP